MMQEIDKFSIEKCIIHNNNHKLRIYFAFNRFMNSKRGNKIIILSLVHSYFIINKVLSYRNTYICYAVWDDIITLMQSKMSMTQTYYLKYIYPNALGKIYMQYTD